ncbi:outer membrane beta-barrel protein [Cysteiniphilum litorale]|uniref:outer membrane beta-barrel protein n=1 Tax=Cysteiniphilum litorale TaxID=2056700 RepID=UPI003F8814C8
MRLNQSICAVVFSGLFSVLPVNQMYAGNLNLSGGLGAGLPINSDVSNTLTGNVGVGWQFTRNASIALNGIFSGKFNSIQAEGIWEIPVSDVISPYGSVGAGWMHLDNNMFAPSIGAGVNFYINDQFAIGVNYRFMFGVYSHTPKVNSLSLSLTYHFDSIWGSNPYYQDSLNQAHRINQLETLYKQQINSRGAGSGLGDDYPSVTHRTQNHNANQVDSHLYQGDTQVEYANLSGAS